MSTPMTLDIDPTLDILGLPKGYLLRFGYQLRCSNPPSADGTSNSHLIATLTANEGTKVDCIAVGNESHEGVLVLDSSQTSFPSTLKCHCGAGPQL